MDPYLVVGPEPLLGHEPGQAGVGSLPQQVLGVEEPGVEVVPEGEDLEGPGCAAPHPGDGDQGPA